MTTTDDGTVLVTRPGPVAEQRTIRVRYGGRSLAALLFLAAAVTLTILGRYEWALLAMAAFAAVMANLAGRYQRDLKWVTGYDKRTGGTR